MQPKMRLDKLGELDDSWDDLLREAALMTVRVEMILIQKSVDGV